MEVRDSSEGLARTSRAKARTSRSEATSLTTASDAASGLQRQTLGRGVYPEQELPQHEAHQRWSFGKAALIERPRQAVPGDEMALTFAAFEIHAPAIERWQVRAEGADFDEARIIVTER